MKYLRMVGAVVGPIGILGLMTDLIPNTPYNLFWIVPVFIAIVWQEKQPALVEANHGKADLR